MSFESRLRRLEEASAPDLLQQWEEWRAACWREALGRLEAVVPEGRLEAVAKELGRQLRAQEPARGRSSGRATAGPAWRRGWPPSRPGHSCPTRCRRGCSTCTWPR
jgi:hypothetical protein